MYKVLKPYGWFSKHHLTEPQDLDRYFTQDSIEEFIKKGYVEKIEEEEIDK